MAWVASKPGSNYGRNAAFVSPTTADQTVVRAFLARVYTFMALGLGVTGVVALAMAASPAAMAASAPTRTPIRSDDRCAAANMATTSR